MLGREFLFFKTSFKLFFERRIFSLIKKLPSTATIYVLVAFLMIKDFFSNMNLRLLSIISIMTFCFFFSGKFFKVKNYLKYTMIILYFSECSFCDVCNLISWSVLCKDFHKLCHLRKMNEFFLIALIISLSEYY